MQLPEAIIFDMDGVLVDSEPFIKSACVQMFAEKGLAVTPEDFNPFTGTGINKFLSGVAEKYNFPFELEKDKTRAYDIYFELINGKMKPINGAADFIAAQKKLGRKLAVASSGDLRKVKGNIAEIKLPIDAFDAIITGSDVQRKKPFPDIFLLAAQRIGVDISRCLVIEDAPNGIAAAKAAGARCVAITSSFTVEQLADADWQCCDLASVPKCAVSW